MSAEIVPFPTDRELCHWCGDYRNNVETLILSSRGADKFQRTTLKICHYCIESWRWFAKMAERNPKPKLRRLK